MAKFADATRKGLNAYERARAARTEMNDVLRQASLELSSAADRDIALRLERERRPARDASSFEAAGITPPPTEMVVVLKLRQEAPVAVSVSLAELEFGELGYPVHLRWRGVAQSAGDRNGFESALVELLQSSYTGAKVAGLIKGRQDGEPPEDDV
jgi:hypothetical protein